MVILIEMMTPSDKYIPQIIFYDHNNFPLNKWNIIDVAVKLTKTVFLLVVAVFAAKYAYSYTQGHSTALIFIVYIISVNLMYGVVLGVFSTFLSMFVYNYFFLEPVFSLDIRDSSDIFTYILFFVVAIPTGYLAGRVRNEARRATQSADLVSAMLTAAHELYGAVEPEEVARLFAAQMQAMCNQRMALFFMSQGRLEIAPPAAMAADETCNLLELANESWRRPISIGVVAMLRNGTRWTFENLGDDRGRVGLAAFECETGIKTQRKALSAALRRQGVIALERAHLIAERGEADTLRRSQKLHDAFLNSVGHDLRTPLTGILGAATTLIDLNSKLPRNTKKKLLLTIRDQAERLNRYVRDLLDMSKVEGSALEYPLQPCDIRDILQSAIGRITPRLGQRTIARHFCGTVSLIETAPALIEQAIVNILENAIAYSPDGSVIEVRAYENSGGVFASISDDGPGVPLADRSRIFDKFHRLDRRGGTDDGSGLGLAIAKGFVEAFGGEITADEHPSKAGARFTISLKVQPHPSRGVNNFNQNFAEERLNEVQ